MNEQSNASEKLDEALISKLSGEDVASFLRNRPDFLVKNRELLIDIQVLLSEKGVVSLTQIQSEQYREKIKHLKSQLDKLVSHARKNEEIYKAYAQLNINIAQTTTFDELIDSLNYGLIKQLGLEKLQLIIIDTSVLFSGDPSTSPGVGTDISLSEIQQHSIFDKKLAKTPFYLGRLGKLERQALFPEAQAESVALIKLEQQKVYGLLAVASKDPMHFSPEMDTMLLEFLRQNLSLHIPKLK